LTVANPGKNSLLIQKRQRRLNAAFNHFLVKVDVPGYGPLVLHYTHNQSTRSAAIPLLFSHGWPGSFVEAVRVVHPLTEPDDATDPAFHFIAPSIPGFGFSPAPTKSGVGPNVVARAYKILMTDVLGYPSFVTQGGDFGSFITRSIAIQYPKIVRAQHLNMFPVPPPSLWSAPRAYLRWCFSAFTYSEFEHMALRVRQNFETDQSGYLEQQKTRPQTLGFALGDSPVGLLAWFVEKFHDWGDVYEAFSDTDIITLVMMHWIQGATPGLRFYREAFGRGKREADKTFEVYVSAPTGVSMYAKEQLHVSSVSLLSYCAKGISILIQPMCKCPRDWADQAANIHYWKEYERGGHFSSLERPDLFVKDLRSFFSSPVVMKSYYGS
jgi:pimeloyl-ACP methyl ester carboxylesterase